ncbi:hypothetical protein QYM36_010442 [Artemia franciscana]|uniref:Translation initiation factor beta propellor-like domain-containing protein n=2 Tax=Artemia franciscana TaxID=6661 RepID=A0AA88LC16_ARTSF|nr:hypothetical protein QYM36_010442 [Artemia franciscana]
MLGGFGNISGKMEIWDVKRHKQIFKAEIPDVTYLCWAADGEHFITGTTAPRLRVNNGFKIWHYTGSLQYEFKVEEGDELYQVALQPIPEGIFPEKEIVTEQVPGIEYATKQDSKKAYIPPSARNRPASDLSTRTQFGVYTKSSHLPPGLAMPAQPIAAAGKKKKKASRNLEDQDIEKSVKTGPQPSLNADVKPVPEILKNDVERNKRISSLNKVFP